MKKVLAVEDNDRVRRWWQEALAGTVEIIGVGTHEEALQFLAGDPEVDAIVMDACLVGRIPDTQPLVEIARQRFHGPIIAVSGDEAFRRILIQAGCDHESAKPRLARKLLEVLGLPDDPTINEDWGPGW